MARHVAIVGLLAGCGFHGPPLGGGEIADAAPVSGCTAGFLDLCAQAAPTTTFEVTSSQTINTDTDMRCRPQGQVSGGNACLIYATSVAIRLGATLSATGSRPLAIASTSTLTVDGAIDVASHDAQRGPAANAAACSFTATPASDSGGGAGGAGGSFGQAGGDGGSGDANDNGVPVGSAAPGRRGATSAVSALRGGCRGQAGGDEGGGGLHGVGGEGGDSGGALYLFARDRISVSGSIRATGAGGAGGGGMSGGGGGGSGGMVVIESGQVVVSGQISANGGGGGQGGGTNGILRIPGNPGRHGALGTAAAPGGSGALLGDPGFGPGGSGGAGTAAAAGTSADFGGGGGGGGAGIIVVRGAAQVSGVVSPAAL
jgi:hypothetical protein